MEEDKDCIFCKIINGEISCTKVYDDDNFIGILDINPIAKGHTLIISKKHFKTLLDIPSSLGNEIIDSAKKIALKLIKEDKTEGFNLIINSFGAAGQDVNHFHAHIIPRKRNDGMRFFVNADKVFE